MAETALAHVRELVAKACDQVAVRDVAEKALKDGRLKRAGRELRGLCCLCGGGGFCIKACGLKWTCYSCGKFGDVVDLERELHGGSAVEAARALLGGDWTPADKRPASKPIAPEASSANKLKLAAEMWRGGRPIAGTLAERYLLGRGIRPEVIAQAQAQIRYHPFAKWGWDDARGDWIKAPAVLLQVVTPDGPTGGVHATYLRRDLAAKDPELGRRMWGPQHGQDGRPGGAWLIGPLLPEGWDWADLVTGEGFETALSVCSLAWPRRLRAVATLSLNRLQGGLLTDDEGCVDLAALTPDPARPPFTWPAPISGPWDEVLVAVDRDMAPIKVKARTGRGKPCQFVLDGEARARICGHLAVVGWKAAGAARARAIAPPPGLDFNDEMRRVTACGSKA